MAKRGSKKKKTGASLKYEMYGILILISSVIALAGQGPIPGMGSVGRALSYICFFIAGELYFVIPLMFIYIGLYVMIHRAWPRSWSARMTGILLVVLGTLILFHIGLFQQFEPNGDHQTSQIIKQPIDNMRELISNQKNIDQFKLELGGGMIGALLYGCLDFFFDDIGSRLVVMALYAIGFMYITGLSYVETGKKIKHLIHLILSRLKENFVEMYSLFLQKRKQRPHTAVRKLAQEPVISMEDEIDEENYRPVRSGNKRPLFFQLLRQEREEPVAEEELAEEDHPEQITTVPQHAAEDLSAHLVDRELDEPADIAEPASGLPFIHDFQDHIKDHEIESEVENPGLNEPVSSAPGSDGALTDGMEELPPVLDKPPAKPYQLPPFNLLSRPNMAGKSGDQSDYKANARKLESTLESFGVRAKVLEIVHGPAVTRYEIQPDVGVKVSRIVSLTDDIALALAAKDLRMEAPIPGKSAIGIEVPNTEVSIVTLREVMESSAFHEAVSKLTVVLGRDISGQPIVGNLAKMPHLLVAGATGSGKSVCINGIITSILYKAKPSEVKFLMVDPKMVELNIYNGIPHLLAPVVTDPRRASLALKKIVVEMEKRYELFSKSSTRNIEGYNTYLQAKGEEPLPFIVIIVDELADLMMVAANDVEESICRLAQMARAAGIHLIIATQRPSVDVITGLIKANIPSRIAFGVSSQVDSRTILDMVGAEKLLGRGDMLFLPVGASKPVRVQGAFLSDQEVEAVVNFVRPQEQVAYREELVPEVEEQAEQGGQVLDELYDQAVQIILDAKQASVSLLQRRMRIGYTRAARLIDSMESLGVVGPYEGSKPREVLITMEQYQSTRKSS